MAIKETWKDPSAFNKNAIVDLIMDLFIKVIEYKNKI